MPSTLERFPANPAASAAHAHLVAVFPTADRDFLEACITHWLAQPAPVHSPHGDRTAIRRWTSQALVEHVTSKLLVIRPEGEFPQRAPTVGCARETASVISDMAQVRRAFGRRTSAQRVGSVRGGAGPAAKTGGRGKKEDITLARNLALIRLHAMFPLVPVAELRALVLAEKHSILFSAAEVLLRRASSLSKRPPQPAFGVDLLGTAASAFARLFAGNGGDAQLGRPGNRKGKERALNADEPVGDPVLTPHDLFHSAAHDAALVAHFEAHFPVLATLPAAPIQCVVFREGGSYTSMRDRLERAAAAAQNERERPWWSRLFGAGTSGRTTSSSTSNERRSLGIGTRRSSETAAREEVHPLIRVEVEAYERGRAGPPPAPSAKGSEQTDDSVAGGLMVDPVADGLMVDCQCCFARVPYTSAQLGHCVDPESPTAFPSTPLNPASHVVCRACLDAYVRTFTFGGTPLPEIALQTAALPCISASGSSPCCRVFTSVELSRTLDTASWRALSARIASTTLDTFALQSSSPSTSAKLLRCPFCPYAELADPRPGALTRVFLPAWVAEPFPPSPQQVLFTLVGALALLVLLLGAALLALVAPARRLEREYDALHPPQSPSDGAGARSPLTLRDCILLAPHHLPPLCAAHVRALSARVLRAREGDGRRVFRCRNDGRPLGARAADWLERCEGVQGLPWDEEGDEGPEGAMEERRREALVRLLWGPDRAKLAADQPPCGRLSCLLCGAAVNSSAPSLHRCRGAAAAQVDESASEHDKAEESLRLAVESAMSDAVKRDCGRCGAALQKETGSGACNKIVCRCGFIYCHACRHEIPTWEGYGHFCPHVRDPVTRACVRCDKCSLWEEPDEGRRVREAAARARLVWAAEHPLWAKKVNLDTPIAFEPDPQEVPLYEWVADGYDAVCEGVVRWLLG